MKQGKGVEWLCAVGEALITRTGELKDVKVGGCLGKGIQARGTVSKMPGGGGMLAYLWDSTIEDEVVRY